MLFNNKTTDKVKKAEQVQKLLSLVESVVKQNNGRPYTDELFHELQVKLLLSLFELSVLKRRILTVVVSQEEAVKLRDQKKEVELLKGYSNNEISEFKKQIDMSYDQQLSRITEMVILFIKVMFIDLCIYIV